MAKKRLARARVDHANELKLELERLRKRRDLEARRRLPGVAKKPKRKVLRYRRHMRIDGVVTRNKRHAKELFYQRLEKRGREMEWEAPEESRPKKRRLVEKREGGECLAVTTLTDGPERFPLAVNASESADSQAEMEM